MFLAFQFFPLHDHRKASGVWRDAKCALASIDVKRSIDMTERRRIIQTEPFRKRLASFAKEARERAARLPPGAEKDELLKKARQADTACYLEDWANSPGLQPPM